MENEYLRLVDQKLMDEFDEGKNNIAMREIIRVAGSNYNEEMKQSEFDYYLNNLQRVDPLKSFQDDWSFGLFQEALLMLKIDNIKCEAILHYIADHENVKIAEDDIVDVCGCCESLAFKLIKQGANVHIRKLFDGHNSLLAAVNAGFTNLVKYLLKCKVDPNYLHLGSGNALHYACLRGNSDIVELIIQSDVKLYSVNEPCSETPLGYTISREKFDLALLILKSKLVNDLEFDQIYDIFCTVCNHELVKADSMDLNVFELVCAMLIQSFSSSTQSNSQRHPILSVYLNNIVFRSEKWSIAMKIILTSTIAAELLDEFAAVEEEGIFGVLMAKFDDAGVERENRMEIIKLLLSLDVQPSLNDLGKALLYFKCEMEFEILSLSLPEDYLLSSNIEENPMQYLASVFCGLRDQLDFEKLKNLDRNFYNRVTQYYTINFEINDDNTKTPNVPSLSELSRSAGRKFVTENTVIQLPKDFSNFVNSLKIPIKLKQFLMLKIPLDEF